MLVILVVRPGGPLVASLLLVAMPFAPSSFLLLVVRPGAPTGVLAPSSDGLHLLAMASDLEAKDKDAYIHLNV